jgi:hypothetical protein
VTPGTRDMRGIGGRGHGAQNPKRGSTNVVPGETAPVVLRCENDGYVCIKFSQNLRGPIAAKRRGNFGPTPVSIKRISRMLAPALTQRSNKHQTNNNSRSVARINFERFVSCDMIAVLQMKRAPQLIAVDRRAVCAEILIRFI